MKRAAAIVLSLMLLWLQAMSSAQTSFVPAKAVRACCGCKQRDCCVTPAAPNPQSLPMTVVPAGAQNILSIPASTLVAWTLAATATAQISASASAPLPALGVPLFTRHCARLI
jgi:hypothetical protein